MPGVGGGEGGYVPTKFACRCPVRGATLSCRCEPLGPCARPI